MHSLELKIPPVIVGLVLGTAAWVVTWLAPGLGFQLPGTRLGAGVLAVVGIAIALLGVAAFRRAQTTVNPLHPDKASHLVIAGIYRRTRNPMYLGMLLVLLGWALSLDHPLALIPAAAFVPVMNRLQIVPEERILAGIFGTEFSDYQAKVRRWL